MFRGWITSLTTLFYKPCNASTSNVLWEYLQLRALYFEMDGRGVIAYSHTIDREFCRAAICKPSMTITVLHVSSHLPIRVLRLKIVGLNAYSAEELFIRTNQDRSQQKPECKSWIFPLKITLSITPWIFFTEYYAQYSLLPPGQGWQLSNPKFYPKVVAFSNPGVMRKQRISTPGVYGNCDIWVKILS